MPFDAMPDDEFEYLMTLSADERAQYLRGKKEVKEGKPQLPNANNAPEGPQRAARRPFNMQSYQEAPMSNAALGAALAAQGGNAQARHLQGMINQTQDAIQDENDSRVAQLREQGRMAHEMNMEAMRQEALLQRLAMEERERERDRILQKQLTTGVTTRKFVPGSGWVDV